MRKQWIPLSILIVGFDQLTKYLSARYLSFSESLPIFPGFDLTLRHNTGAAFSFLADASGWQRWLFVMLALVMCGIIYIWLGKLSLEERQEALGLSLIFGGALGNLLDRITHGYVIDFILLYYEKWQWPAFNLADTAICIGAALLVPILFKKSY